MAEMYQNPILLCDYSDPDAIRVGDTYYLTASSFNYVPGLPILKSYDLVHWRLVNYALDRIPDTRYDRPCHAQGVWAPAIRYRNGWFMIYYGMPDEGIFVVRTRDPEGAWEKPVCVLAGKGLIDPCPIWNEDGTACVVHGYAKSRIGFNSMLGMFPVNAEGLKATGDDHIIYDGRETQPTIEGPKAYRRGKYVYIFAPAGGVATGWQTVLRSEKIGKQWEEKVVLKQGSSPVNGPHQGAWVDTENGDHYFLHFQSRGAYGRIVHLQPMRWEDDWPVMGQTDPAPVDPSAIAVGEGAEKAAPLANAADCGIPVAQWSVPEGHAIEENLEMSDSFSEKLGPHWQWMANSRADFAAVGNGQLLLNALPFGGNVLWNCPQVLTQKISALDFTVTVPIDASALAVGGTAGLTLMGGQYAYLAIRREEKGCKLVFVTSSDDEKGNKVENELFSAPCSEKLSLRMNLCNIGYARAEADFLVSMDGKEWGMVYEGFEPSRHTWVGARVGLFAMAAGKEKACGSAAFGVFDVETK